MGERIDSWVIEPAQRLADRQCRKILLRAALQLSFFPIYLATLWVLGLIYIRPALMAEIVPAVISTVFVLVLMVLMIWARYITVLDLLDTDETTDWVS